jgi:uncharacterized protein (TIGR02246 family)
MNPGTDRQTTELAQIAVHLAAAFNAHDAEGLSTLYTERAVLMPPNEPAVSGRAEIRRWFEQALARIGEVGIVPVESMILGEHAFQVGTFTSVARPTGDSSRLPAQQATGKYMLLLTRSEGRWKIRYDIWSLDHQPGAA